MDKTAAASDTGLEHCREYLRMLARLQLQRLTGAPAPPAVLAEGQHRVGAVVAAGDGVEHRGHVPGLFGQARTVRHGVGLPTSGVSRTSVPQLTQRTHRGTLCRTGLWPP